jgi:hypothetical protein
MKSLLARVDGLPAQPIVSERVWPVPAPPEPPLRPARLSQRLRERIARQTAVVHEAHTPAWASGLLAEPVDLEIHVELAAAGLL